MRSATLLLAALLLAGCSASQDDGTAPDESGAPPGQTPSAPEAGEAIPTPEPVEIRHDFSAPAETVSFEVATGQYAFDVGFEAPPSVMGCVSPDARVVVKDPTGAVFAEAAMSAVQTPCEITQSGKHMNGAIAAGTWTAEFSGSGAAIGVVRLSPA